MTQNIKSNNERSIYLKDKNLIVLKAAFDYCDINEVDKIRYTKLKVDSNDILSEVTNGASDDFGGNFENIIKYLESGGATQSFLKREKRSTRESYIIPNIQKIRRLFEKKGLSFSHETDISEYIADIDPGDSPRGHPGLYRISNLSDSIQIFQDWIHLAKRKQVYKSQNWDVSLFIMDKFNLNDNQISQSLELGKKISSSNPSLPFKLIIEYRPESFPTSYCGDQETFIRQM